MPSGRSFRLEKKSSVELPKMASYEIENNRTYQDLDRFVLFENIIVLHLSEHVAVHGATDSLVLIIRVGLFASDVSHVDTLFDSALLCSNNAYSDECQRPQDVSDER